MCWPHCPGFSCDGLLIVGSRWWNKMLMAPGKQRVASRRCSPQISFKYMCSDLLPSTRPGCLCVPPYLNSWLETKSLAYRPLGALIKVKNTYYLEIQEIQKVFDDNLLPKNQGLGFLFDKYNPGLTQHVYSHTLICTNTYM